MTWLRRILTGRAQVNLPVDPNDISMPGWQLVDRELSTAFWRDPAGDAVSLTFRPPDRHLPQLSATGELHSYCRRMAESQNAGLVEVSTIASAEGPSLTCIYKRLKVPAFTFFGWIITPVSTGNWMWLIVANEHGTTGVREAVVTTELFESGELTIETYESSWAQDPYDPSYQGVDRSTLRYMSDSEEYDDRFPNHPLTKTRRELHRLLRVPLSPHPAS